MTKFYLQILVTIVRHLRIVIMAVSLTKISRKAQFQLQPPIYGDLSLTTSSNVTAVLDEFVGK